ncbi:kelch-like protein 25 isoform X2 [Salminus brasiliensis]
MDGYMYALGGYDGTVCTSTVERYDPEMNSWTKLSSMRQPRSGGVATALDGYLYVMGGTDGDMPLCSVERFNPLDGTWQTCAPMGTPRERPGCAVYLGCLYVAGGRDELLLELSTVEKFDPHILRWTPVPRMRNKRHQVSLLVFGEKLLAVGGWDGTSNLRTIETYNPDANTWRHFGCVKVSHPGGQSVLVKTTQEDAL